MKNLFGFLLLALMPCLVGWSYVGETVATSAECSTPQDGNEMNEGFLGTGYENTWTETIGTNGTVDEDYTLSSGWTSGSCSEGLNIVIPLSGGNTSTRYDIGFATTDTYDIYAEFKVSSVTLPAYGRIQLLSVYQQYSGNFNDISISVDDLANYSLRAHGSQTSNNISFITGVTYTVRYHIDGTTPANSYIQLDGGTQYSFTPSTAMTSADWLILGANDLTDSTDAMDIEFGRVWVVR